jgi:hypothetical protein
VAGGPVGVILADVEQIPVVIFVPAAVALAAVAVVGAWLARRSRSPERREHNGGEGDRRRR